MSKETVIVVRTFETFYWQLGCPINPIDLCNSDNTEIYFWFEQFAGWAYFHRKRAYDFSLSFPFRFRERDRERRNRSRDRDRDRDNRDRSRDRTRRSRWIWWMRIWMWLSVVYTPEFYVIFILFYLFVPQCFFSNQNNSIFFVKQLWNESIHDVRPWKKHFHKHTECVRIYRRKEFYAKELKNRNLFAFETGFRDGVALRWLLHFIAVCYAHWIVHYSRTMQQGIMSCFVFKNS